MLDVSPARKTRSECTFNELMGTEVVRSLCHSRSKIRPGSFRGPGLSSLGYGWATVRSRMTRSRLIALMVCLVVLPVGRAAVTPRTHTEGHHPQARPFTGQIPGNDNPPQPARPGGTDTSDPNHPVVGFLCSTERQLWVQTKRCPATYRAEAGGGPVRQRQLSRQTMCQYLAFGSPVRPDSPASQQSKERAALLRKLRCGG
jgi:hypothetical protein